MGLNQIAPSSHSSHCPTPASQTWLSSIWSEETHNYNVCYFISFDLRCGFWHHQGHQLVSYHISGLPLTVWSPLAVTGSPWLAVPFYHHPCVYAHLSRNLGSSVRTYVRTYHLAHIEWAGANAIEWRLPWLTDHLRQTITDELELRIRTIRFEIWAPPRSKTPSRFQMHRSSKFPVPFQNYRGALQEVEACHCIPVGNGFRPAPPEDVQRTATERPSNFHSNITSEGGVGRFNSVADGEATYSERPE